MPARRRALRLRALPCAFTIPETNSAIPLALSDGLLSMGFLLLPANWNEDGVSPYWKVKPLPAKFLRATQWSGSSVGRTLGPVGHSG